MKYGAHRIPITPNCFAALKGLEARLRGQSLAIWVDAICINQSDEAEKMRQIPMMGDIYSKAAVTYIWLGEGNEEMDRAMKFLSTAGFPGYFKRSGGSLSLRLWAYAAALVSLTPFVLAYPLESQYTPSRVEKVSSC